LFGVTEGNGAEVFESVVGLEEAGVDCQSDGGLSDGDDGGYGGGDE